MSQYLQLFPDGTSPYVEVEPDPTFSDAVSEAYFSVLLYIPSSAKPDLDAHIGSAVHGTWDGDNFFVGIHKTGGNYFWHSGTLAGPGTDFAPVTFDAWFQLELHALAGASAYDVRIDSTLYAGGVTAGLPATGINYFSVDSLMPNSWVASGGGVLADDWIGIDEMSWAFDDWVSMGGTVYTRWAFEAADPIGDAVAAYPDPPWFASADSSSFVIQSGGGTEPDLLPGAGGSDSDTATSDPTDVVEALGPGEEPPGESGGSDCDIQVFIDGSDVSSVAIFGSVTRRLNRPSQASITIPMDSAIGGPGSRLKIYFDGTLWFHGMILDCETDSGEDEGQTVYNASDPMEMWRYRPARDGPAYTDPGDFSNPSLFLEFAPATEGPFVIEQMLLQSEDDSDPALGEGPLFLDLGTFETGGVDLSGAPTDWPMTIAEVVNLLCSTGEVDVVITPTDPGGGVMGTVDVYNGDYGTDLSGSVTLSYGMGDYSIRRVRWNEDMSNICNKLWYFGGPRILSAADPEGNQHWCFNVQGDDPGLPGYPSDPPYSTVIDCRDASRDSYGVRMDIQIYDAASDNCADKLSADTRELYRRLWIAESYLRCNPRELIHVTPVRGYPVGTFDIGDLITVEAVATVRGGFSGAQRIYQYTVSWDADGPCEISELQTSPNNEGI